MVKRNNRILQGNCIEVMRQLPDGCVDLIFADPPYFMQLHKELFRPDATSVGGVDDEWDKFTDFKAYDAFTLDWLKEARRVLKDDGALWVIGSYHNIFRVGYHLQNMGFWILNDILWLKTNPMPNFRGTRFANAHETLIWCAKNPHSKYTFNYDSLKSFNDDLQVRSDWLLPICGRTERLKDKSGKKVHTTQKPESLLYRVILSSTNPGDVILDPFFGTGTTGAVAKKLGRRYIGIEQDPSYIKYAQKRLKAIEAETDTSLFELHRKKEEPRIPFGDVVASGLLKVGTRLYSPKKKVCAKVRADGTLMAPEGCGSIHQLGALLQKKKSCNGWLYWSYQNRKTRRLVLIDTLRQQLKTEMEKEK